MCYSGCGFFMAARPKQAEPSTRMWKETEDGRSVSSQLNPSNAAFTSSFRGLVRSDSLSLLVLLCLLCSFSWTSIQRAIYQDETNESLRQLTEQPSKANSALLLKRVGVFNITEKRKMSSWDQFGFSSICHFLFSLVVIFLPLTHTGREPASQRSRTKPPYCSPL